MNATTGEAHDPCIKATATLTLALPKTGFLAREASLYLGDLYLADISIPRKVYQDRKSTRLNSSHITISYAVFCLKKKKKQKKSNRKQNNRKHNHNKANY